MTSDEKTHTRLLVEDFMTPVVFSVLPGMTVREAIHLLVSNKISGAPIVDSTLKVISVLSEGDAMKLAATGKLDLKISTFLDQLVPTDKLINVTKTHTFVHVYRLFLRNPVHRIFVTDGVGKIQGIVSRSNILGTFVHQNVPTEKS